MKEIYKDWDYLILTASNLEQATAYRNQLNIREDLGFLSGIQRTLVVPDPEGKRVGSAGSAIFALMQVLTLELGDHASKADAKSQESWKEILERLRILIIHAGGDSKRLPAYGAYGKAFIPLPGEQASVLGQTIFDRQLPVYRDLPGMERGRGQVIITTGDVLLDFDVSEVQFGKEGVTGLGYLAPPELARNHGVFIPSEDGTVKFFLQKPSVREQEGNGALEADGRTLLDIGILNWDVASAMKLLELAGVRWDEENGLCWSGRVADAIDSGGVDLYKEVCCAMGSDMDLNRYIAHMEKGRSHVEKSCLERIFKFMSDTRFGVQTLSRCDFLHFGSIRQVMKSGITLFEKDTGAGPKDSIVSVNNRIRDEGLVRGHGAWIEGCSIAAAVDLGGENALVGIDIDEPIVIPENACVDVIAGQSPTGDSASFVRIYGMDDRIKDPVGSGTLFCNMAFRDWIHGMGAEELDLWDIELSSEVRSIWNARIYPSVKNPRKFKDWLWMFQPQKATVTQRQMWRENDRYSFEDMARLADHEEFYSKRMSYRACLFLSSVNYLFQPKSGFSARELSHLFGQLNEDDCADLCVSILKMAHDLKSIGSKKFGQSRLKLSRVFHTLATSIKLSGEHYAVPWTKILGEVQRRSSEGDNFLWQSLEIGSYSKSGTLQWTKNMYDHAFFNLRKAIVTTRRNEGTRPKNTLRKDEIVWGRAPVRLDLGGGWTDTPPYALERGGKVINAAVELNGQPPIHVYARLIDALEIRIASIDHGKRICVKDLEELMDFKQPTSEFALAKASLALAGLSPQKIFWPRDAASLQDILRHFGGGIELTTLAAIPSGSGLGTSSIMGAVLLSVLHRILGRELSQRELFHAVLQLEQELTTGGGWQDQIGGTIKGVKTISTGPGMVPDPEIIPVCPDLCDPTCNGRQTLLYYTGMRRLAKNILRNVVGSYLDRDRRAMDTLKKLHRLPPLIADTLSRKDINGFGERIDLAWRLNKEIDPDSSNREIEEILALFRPYMYGAKLLGAGGGGFLLVICKSPEDAAEARRQLENNPPNPLARFFDYEISQTGLELSVC